jgi:hypothetical protein
VYAVKTGLPPLAFDIDGPKYGVLHRPTRIPDISRGEVSGLIDLVISNGNLLLLALTSIKNRNLGMLAGCREQLITTCFPVAPSVSAGE